MGRARGLHVVGFPRVSAVGARRPGRSRAAPARAVDTATDPEFQGRGIFTRLTLEALDALPAEGVELVFNTPNARASPAT